ncbi:hypothetical protein [Rudaea cellulosilytica]|uniref:hypothetical protein n=1 Tax=Rudaea cellulosilytica TaxID=540746 RepID=UPI0003A33190|nr:hypothetical protein [Rudaea cellulosilytica]
MKPSFAELATEAIDLARAARDLVEAEWALSRQGLRRFVIGALVFPIFVAAFWLAANGLLIAVLHSFGCGLSGAFAIDVGFQFVILLALLHALQRSLREMSFPNSRRALEQVKKEFS